MTEIFSTYCRVLTNWQGMVKCLLKDQSISCSLSAFNLMEYQDMKYMEYQDMDNMVFRLCF